MKRFLSFLLWAGLASQLSFAQDIQLSPTVIASAGNYAETDNISISWTLGEVAVSTLQQGDIILTQGFQQPYTSGTGITNDPINWQITAYPIPATDHINLQFDIPAEEDFFIEIQDITGKIISQLQYKQVYPGDVIPVEVSSYTSGVYFFRISTLDRDQVRIISVQKQ